MEKKVEANFDQTQLCSESFNNFVLPMFCLSFDDWSKFWVILSIKVVANKGSSFPVLKGSSSFIESPQSLKLFELRPFGSNIGCLSPNKETGIYCKLEWDQKQVWSKDAHTATLQSQKHTKHTYKHTCIHDMQANEPPCFQKLLILLIDGLKRCLIWCKTVKTQNPEMQ